MITQLLMVMVAQCGPGGCPAPRMVLPSYRPPAVHFQQPTYVQQPVYRVVDEPAMREPPRKYDWHRIRHDGLSFYVWGFPIGGSQVEWDDSLPENVREYAKAKVKLAEQQAKSAAEAEQKARTADEKKEVVKVVNYGVDPTKRHLAPHYTANSIEAANFVRESQAKTEKTGDRLYVTVIGKPSDCREAKDDWKNHHDYDEWRDKVWFQEFKAEDWQVKDELGYHAKGRPSVLVQKSSGEVLLRMDRYDGPASIVNALRKADPNYKPEKDPGPNSDPLGLDGDNVRMYAAIAAMALAALVLLPKRKK